MSRQMLLYELFIDEVNEKIWWIFFSEEEEILLYIYIYKYNFEG